MIHLEKYGFDRHLIYYVLIGLLGAVLDFGSFAVLDIVFDGNYLVANTISSSLGILNNFIFNYRYNFRLEDGFWRRCALFFAVGIGGIIVGNGLIFIFVEMVGLSSILSKCFALGIVVAAQYLVNRFATFKTQ